MLTTTEKIKVDLSLHQAPPNSTVSSNIGKPCKLCRGTIDFSSVLESGFDDALSSFSEDFHSPPDSQILLKILQERFLDFEFEREICHGCRGMLNGCKSREGKRKVIGLFE